MGSIDSPHCRGGGAFRGFGLRVLGALLALWTLSPAPPASALGNFTRHITITVGAGVVGGPLSNFPVLVDVTNADLHCATAGPACNPVGSVQSTNGYDIVFRGQDDTTCGGAGTSPCTLDHEIELYDGAAGRVVAWVRVPSLVASTSVIHMYYGNNQITSATETPGAVFDADYVGVWHLKESGNGTLNEYRDSSRYGNQGQGGQGAANATPTRVAGKIGYGQHWDKATDNVADFIDVGQDGSLNITGNQITLEGWVNHDITLSYSTGTATVAAGGTVVNFTGATLPAWVGPNDYIAFGGASPETVLIALRNSATQVTLSWGTANNHPGDPYTILAAQPYGVVNHKGFYDGYRLYLDADPAACPTPSGALTDPCVGFAVPGASDRLGSSQYGSPATDPVTRGMWHHVVGTYDNTEMKLYVDGQKVLAAGGMGNHLLDDGTCWAAGLHCASVGAGGTTVTFDTALPASVGTGDVLIFDTRQGGTVENLLITGVSGPRTQATVSPAAAYNHVAATGAYRITSPFKTGNVPPSMAEQHVWIGHADQQQNVGWSSPWVGDLDEVRISRVARSAGWIQTEYNNQDDPTTFSTAGAAGGVAPLSLPTLTTVYRSIGTNGATLYSTGTASVGVNGTVVTFAGGASLPANIGQGDQLDLTGPAETLFILSRDSATQVTVQAPATSAHAAGYTIKRAFGGATALQDWENALPADLVAANVREVGVACNDGVFAAGVTFSGSVTDPARNIVLTTRMGNRQKGKPNNPYGTTNGVVLDNGSNAGAAISISDDHVTVERFEIKGGSGTGAHGIEFASVNPANIGTVRDNLIHNTGGDGIRLSDADSIVDIYNNFIFGANVGIRLLVDMNPSARVEISNNTVYNSTAAGIASRDGGGAFVRQQSLRVSLRNNIAHSNPVDLDIAREFSEAYFCTTVSGTDPTGCTDITTQSKDPTANYHLPFASQDTCLYVGSSHMFRGVGASVVTGGSYSPNLTWEYWNGAWTSLATQIPALRSHDFQWNGFAYWPDDPGGWTARAVSSATSLYYVRICGYYAYTDGYALVNLGDTNVTFSDNLPAVSARGTRSSSPTAGAGRPRLSPSPRASTPPT